VAPKDALEISGWIDLPWEGFCYAQNVGRLPFSVVTQGLVN